MQMRLEIGLDKSGEPAPTVLGDGGSYNKHSPLAMNDLRGTDISVSTLPDWFLDTQED